MELIINSCTVISNSKKLLFNISIYISNILLFFNNKISKTICKFYYGKYWWN